jgi:formylglycine-generating enzyme required for sulfatase activity
MTQIDDSSITPAHLNTLSIQISDLGRQDGMWWFQIEIHGHGDHPEGVEIALYLYNRRLEVGNLDEWGDWSVRVCGLKLKAGEHVCFEVRSRHPRLSTQSDVVSVGGLVATLEKERTWTRKESLYGSDLSGAHLSDARLDGLDLRETLFIGAKLARASLKNCVLCRANFEEADLYQADLTGADLEGAYFEGADLEGTCFEGADLRKSQGIPLNILETWLDKARLDSQQKESIFSSQSQRLEKARNAQSQKQNQLDTQRELQRLEEQKLKEELKEQARQQIELYSIEKQEQKSRQYALDQARRLKEQQERQALEHARVEELRQEEDRQQRQAQQYALELEKQLQSQNRLIQKRQQSWISEEERIHNTLKQWRLRFKEWKRNEEGRFRDHLALWQDQKEEWEYKNKKLLQKIRLGLEIEQPPKRPIYESPFETPPLPPQSIRAFEEESIAFRTIYPHSFFMGESDVIQGSRPLQEVCLTRCFMVSETPITQEIWNIVMHQSPSWFKGIQRPVEHISWWDAVHFCNQLSTLDGLTPTYHINNERQIKWNANANGYRLLTDAEWEGVARAGFNLKYTLKRPFEDVGWSLSNSNRHTQRVGQKEANYFGVYDLCGLVSEWVFDDYSTQYYGKQGSLRVDDPIYLDTVNTFKIVRGGNWESSTDECHITARDSVRPTQNTPNIGFRIARTLLNIKGLSPSSLTIPADVNQLPQPT